jgi:hypothetical protein
VLFSRLSPDIENAGDIDMSKSSKWTLVDLFPCGISQQTSHTGQSKGNFCLHVRWDWIIGIELSIVKAEKD